jgi:response regulator RpfG family c-di-GMP phosphodiesterase
MNIQAGVSMRLLVVLNNGTVKHSWVDSIRPHWPGLIEVCETNAEALARLNSPYFFPLMACQADRETILQARSRGVQRFVILPCDATQLVQEINSNILGLSKAQGRDAQVQLHVMNQTLNSLCHGPVTHSQLQWLKQRCTGEHLQLACAAIDQVLRYMDQPNPRTAEIKNALLELSGQVQYRVDRVLSLQYA